MNDILRDDPGALHEGPGVDSASDPAARGSGARTASGWDEGADLTKDAAVVPDPAEVDVPEELRREIEGYIARYPERHSAALPALAAAQRLHGWCSPEALRQVAAVMRVTPGYLSSIVTFYDMLLAEPLGRHYVWVCTSVACHLRNAKAVFDALAEQGSDLDDVHIREFECLGACEMAPMASVDGRFLGPLDEVDVPEIVAALRDGRTPLPGRALGDEGFRLPWETGAEAERHGPPPDARPTEREVGTPPGGGTPGPSAGLSEGGAA